VNGIDIYNIKIHNLSEVNRDPHKYAKHAFHENGVTKHTNHNDGRTITPQIKNTRIK
jgi:hypothetical protein